MKIAVGSTNPVKVEAVREAFRLYYPEAQIVGTTVESGVGEQPTSHTETILGAKQRAKRAMMTSGADYGVGLEGGVTEIDGQMFECAWAAVMATDAKTKIIKLGMGGGLYFELPDKVAAKIRNGGELGPVMDELTGESNIKQKMGAVGVFTKGKLDRKSAYVQIILSALVKFVSPEWFE